MAVRHLSRDFTPPRIRTWAEALQHNRVINTVDSLSRLPAARHYHFEARPPGTPFPSRALDFARPFIEFVQVEQLHRDAEETKDGFAAVAELRHSDPEYFYFSRYSSKEYLFGEGAKALGFVGRRGLDVGCVTQGLPQTVFYNRGFRMQMQGIDINLPVEREQPNIIQADVRNLPFEDDSFDFATVAMIFGLGRPSDTILEIAVGISELSRVTNGFIYLADRHVMPEVVFVAQEMGFRVFITPRPYSEMGDLNLFPMGMFLVRKDIPLEQNVFSRLLPRLAEEGAEIDAVAPDQDLVLPIRNLLVEG